MIEFFSYSYRRPEELYARASGCLVRTNNYCERENGVTSGTTKSTVISTSSTFRRGAFLYARLSARPQSKSLLRGEAIPFPWLFGILQVRRGRRCGGKDSTFIAWRIIANIISLSIDIFLNVPESCVGMTQNTSKFVRDHRCQESAKKKHTTETLQDRYPHLTDRRQIISLQLGARADPCVDPLADGRILPDIGGMGLGLAGFPPSSSLLCCLVFWCCGRVFMKKGTGEMVVGRGECWADRWGYALYLYSLSDDVDCCGAVEGV